MFYFGMDYLQRLCTVVYANSGSLKLMNIEIHFINVIKMSALIQTLKSDQHISKWSLEWDNILVVLIL
jgi:hypothetical protein